MNSTLFYQKFGDAQQNVVAAIKGEELLLIHEGTLFDAVVLLNQRFKNFRLTGIIFYTLDEPSLKERGLLLLSRVQEVVFFRKSALQVPEIWDSFKVHAVRMRYGREDVASDSTSD